MLDREFGKYRLIRRLGRGGMADVYLAADTGRGVEVALKLVEIRSDRDSRDICEAERRGVLLQEQFCEVDAHVPRVNGYGTHAGYFYIDMEYVDGEDLAERIARAPLPPDEAAWIASEICTFLEKAHQFQATLDDRRIRGLIHGDIKPKNVRLNLAGDVKVLDFGIAKGLALSRKLTRNDFGSLSYLSPERLDTGEVDAHVDFWSVGVLLFEMIAGSVPYQADTSQALESLIRSRQPPAPLPDTCPPPLARIILKMLAGAPARRYADAGLIRHDLEAFRRGEPTVADAEWMALQPEGDTRRTGLSVSTPAEAGSDATSRTDVAVAESEATRRTEAGAAVIEADTEATRRTVPEADLVGASTAPDAVASAKTANAGQPSKTPARGKPHATTRAQWSRWLAALVVLTVIGLAANEVNVWTAARRIRVGLATGQNSEMQGLWDEYQGLTHRSLLGIGLVGVKGAMKERLLSQAERVIADYRQDAPTVREAQWRDAGIWLTDVLNLDPGDRSAAARLRYCEGHLQRIDGETRKRKKLSASDAFHEAVAKFEEAGRVDSRWPDPYLGLARTYIYGLDDLDRAIPALKEAEHRGYRPGNRELVQLADGYRSRADRWRREAAAVRGLGQERDCLQKSADDYRQALDLYQKAIGFGESSTSVRTIQSRLDEVEKRLSQKNEPPQESRQ
jgi:eukaryotic-like serine/threonine-protein kinase